MLRETIIRVFRQGYARGQAQPPITNGVVESNIDGDFNGWEGETITEAQDTFRDLASQMRGFAQAEPIAAMIVERVFKYEPMKISTALIGYSNEISTYGEGRHLYKVQIEKLLRIGVAAG